MLEKKVTWSSGFYYGWIMIWEMNVVWMHILSFCKYFEYEILNWNQESIFHSGNIF
jgi:hypothetical protein